MWKKKLKLVNLGKVTRKSKHRRQWLFEISFLRTRALKIGNQLILCWKVRRRIVRVRVVGPMFASYSALVCWPSAGQSQIDGPASEDRCELLTPTIAFDALDAVSLTVRAPGALLDVKHESSEYARSKCAFGFLCEVRIRWWNRKNASDLHRPNESSRTKRKRKEGINNWPVCLAAFAVFYFSSFIPLLSSVMLCCWSSNDNTRPASTHVWVREYEFVVNIS